MSFNVKCSSLHPFVADASVGVCPHHSLVLERLQVCEGGAHAAGVALLLRRRTAHESKLEGECHGLSVLTSTGDHRLSQELPVSLLVHVLDLALHECSFLVKSCVNPHAHVLRPRVRDVAPITDFVRRHAAHPWDTLLHLQACLDPMLVVDVDDQSSLIVDNRRLERKLDHAHPLLRLLGDVHHQPVTRSSLGGIVLERFAPIIRLRFWDNQIALSLLPLDVLRRVAPAASSAVNITLVGAEVESLRTPLLELPRKRGRGHHGRLLGVCRLLLGFRVSLHAYA
mmetsp:Transcript_34574/g.66924  ORF Transcript_34574/g.66924 Transcript_34574/m.66924 type:complete len:283 (-) Transcript_34574:21-869(-)